MPDERVHSELGPLLSVYRIGRLLLLVRSIFGLPGSAQDLLVLGAYFVVGVVIPGLRPLRLR